MNNDRIFSPRPALVAVALGVLALVTACGTIPAARPSRPGNQTSPGATQPGSATTATQPTGSTSQPPAITAPLSQDDGMRQISEDMSHGEVTAAISIYKKTKFRDPEDPANLVLLANLYLASGQLEDAKTTLDHVVSKDPNNADALYDLSLIAGANGDSKTQQNLLQKVVAIAPTNADAQASLGDIYLSQSNESDAEKAFNESLATDPRNVLALVGLGSIYTQQQKLDQADQALTKAIDAEPDFAQAYVDRGKVRADNGDYAGGEADLTKAIQLEPDYVWHYVDRGRIRARMGHQSGAVEDFTKAIALNPKDFMNYIDRGQVYDALGKLQEALADYESGLALRPDYYPIYGETGALEFMAGRFADSAAMFQKAFAASAQDYSYPLIAVIAYRLAGQEKAAQNYLSGVVDKFPRDTPFYSMGRYLLTPQNDSGIFREVTGLKDKLVKAKMYFLLGAEYWIQNKLDLARSVLLEIDKSAFPTLMESRLADWLVHAGPSPDSAAPAK